MVTRGNPEQTKQTYLYLFIYRQCQTISNHKLQKQIKIPDMAKCDSKNHTCTREDSRNPKCQVDVDRKSTATTATQGPSSASVRKSHRARSRRADCRSQRHFRRLIHSDDTRFYADASQDYFGASYQFTAAAGVGGSTHVSVTVETKSILNRGNFEYQADTMCKIRPHTPTPSGADRPMSDQECAADHGSNAPCCGQGGGKVPAAEPVRCVPNLC